MSTTIRLTINNDLKSAFDLFKQNYPLLSYDEILKLAISKFYSEELRLTKSVFINLVEDYIKDTKKTAFNSDEEMMEWWLKNKNQLRKNE